MEIRARYNTLLRYTVLVLGTSKFRNNTNQINSRNLTKAFFHFVQKKMTIIIDPFLEGGHPFKTGSLILVTN